MPFTLAHPAVLLPLANRRGWWHFPAMVLGSMAPDFEYFLRGRAVGAYGHTLWGVVLFDLPLVVLVYLVGKYLVVRSLRPYFPQLPPLTQPHQPRNKTVAGLVFYYSALFGIATHIIWDSFTHRTGWVVKHWPVFRGTISLFGYKTPLYSLLQDSSSLIGLIAIAWFLLYRYIRHDKVRLGPAALRRKVVFWVISVVLALVILLLWNLLDGISLAYPVTWLVRSIDAAILSLLLLAVVNLLDVAR